MHSDTLTVAKPITPFPTLIDATPERWQWPVPPFAWRHLPPPTNDIAQPCQIELVGGSKIEGDMLGFDPSAKCVAFRNGGKGQVVEIPFSRFRRLMLTMPLQQVPPMRGAPVERVPAAAQVREYSLDLDDMEPLTGRTAGYVETKDGLYLFAPVNEESSVQRVFVPSTAFNRREFGPSTEEVAARRWIASPADLREALAQQERKPVLPLGYSLRELGLVTEAQLYRSLGGQPAGVPLGEMLVASGLIKRSDLQTALAHKMGYPLVDLTRFPVDPAAAAKLTHRMAMTYRAMPLMLDQERLIVAVDKPSRAVKLRDLHALAGVVVVPVLAPKAQVIMALERLSKDVWTNVAPQRMGYFETTV